MDSCKIGNKNGSIYIQCNICGLKSFNPNDVKYKYCGYEAIFVGHTSTMIYNRPEPINWCNIWDIDTGAGWEWKLTFMDIDTKEFWQSDTSKSLYPGETGR